MDGFMQSADYDYLKDTELVNMADENNRHAACINTSPDGVAGSYSCSRGPLMLELDTSPSVLPLPFPLLL